MSVETATLSIPKREINPNTPCYRFPLTEFKGRSFPKIRSDRFASPPLFVDEHTRTRARSYVNISSTRRGHVFSAGAPNPRWFSPLGCSPPPPQANPGRSFQDTVGYPQRIRPFIRTLLYSLHNIVPARPPTIAREEIRVAHTPRYCIPYAHAL